MAVDARALDETLAAATDRLLAERNAAGHWRGRLSSSALSTATAVFALWLADSRKYHKLISRGTSWLLENVNEDGGWGDTTRSGSNISTTLLARAVLATAGGGRDDCAQVAARAADWLAGRTGSCRPADIASAVSARYGRDRTFAAPILTMCAIAGLLGPGRQAWRHVRPMPFELAICRRSWLRLLRLPVVSYALPALIAVGQARYHHRPPANPITRLLRLAARRRSLSTLRGIQPPNGGFLEAPPLTSFVAMNLIASGRREDAVVRRCLEFLVRSARGDGSFPIDTDLATWVSSLSVNALGAGGGGDGRYPAADRDKILDWLIAQQHKARRPYTDTPPGGWGWSDLPGCLPDADDTSLALLALRRLDAGGERSARAAGGGVGWLVRLQNADGGMPTFCRGWGKLPFDRSSPDLTAHSALAIAAWLKGLSGPVKYQARRALRKAIAYLLRAQRPDGAYAPLWFGNEMAANEANLTYGTSRVTAAMAKLSPLGLAGCGEALLRGVGWLLASQGRDGGWGGDASAPASIEETAVAVAALARAADTVRVPKLTDGIAAGVSWLIERTEGGRRFPASPIGLYFAKLWYFEELYPLIFTVAALRRARAMLRNQPR
ncbi:MAG: prenyltransferase/squalene oxidase repeat-containing protein [Planctomycetota bacterium]|jgi:squalene-hopene/tetraprenyl-beta-curcumene cyclase